MATAEDYIDLTENYGAGVQKVDSSKITSGGADLYIYTGGDDLIQDYATVDAIKIDINEITVYGVATVGTNAVVKTSEGNITLKGAKTKTVNLKDIDGKKINLSNVSKNVAEEKIWFLDDDNNFVASDIDSVTENKFAVTDIKPQNYSALAQDLTILTFTDKK